LAACRVGQGSGEVVGDLSVSECKGTQPFVAPNYDMGVSVFCAEPVQIDNHDFLFIRLQRGGNVFEQNDAFYFVIRNVAIAASGGSEIEVGPDKNISARLILRATCPDAYAKVEGVGTIRFERFGGALFNGAPPPMSSSDRGFSVEYGDDVTATFDVTLTTLSSADGTAQVSGRLRGSFDFPVRRGSPCQKFP
jgi:hypothetical protein